MLFIKSAKLFILMKWEPKGLKMGWGNVGNYL